MSDYEILNAAKSGHNILITGQAGTGKSSNLINIKRELSNNKHVVLLATTGIASSVLAEGCMTVHRFFCLKDGRYRDDTVINHIMNDDNQHERKTEIVKTDVIMIDEVSMLSLKVLSQIDSILQAVKGCGVHFGGVQVILCGDFYQLKPVPSPQYGDSGEYIIPVLNTFHMFQLKQVHRQHGDLLIKSIHSVSKGQITHETRDFVRRMNRPLPPGDQPVKIFAENYDVDLFNAQCLFAAEGPMKTYTSEDSGELTKLERCVIPRKISLKKGCPVILIVNVTRLLVNGLRGTVHDVDETSVSVLFKSIGIHTLKQYMFSVYDQEQGRDVAFRKQIPLKPAYALTVHKCQGLTLDRVEIDARHMHNPGQLGVAIGRVTSAKGLRVINFSNANLRRHPPEVNALYCKVFLPLLLDLTCCRNSNVNVECNGPGNGGNKGGNCDDNSDSETLVEDLEDIALVEKLFQEWESDGVERSLQYDDSESIDTIPLNFDVDFDKLMYKDPKTEDQKSINSCFCYLTQTPDAIKRFCWQVYSELNRCFETFPEKLQNKHFTMLYNKMSLFMNGQTYKSSVKCLFSPSDTDGTHFRAAFYLVQWVREFFLQNKTKPIIENAAKEVSSLSAYKDSKGSRAKVRYIGGWCVAKLRHNKKRKVGRSLYIESLHLTVRRISSQVRLLEQLKEQEDDLLQSTSDLESVSEILRKQNKTKGLLHLSDAAYSFFLLLDKTVCKLETISNLHLHRKTFYEHVKTEVCADDDIKNCWKSLFKNEDDLDVSTCEGDINTVLDEVIAKYIRMSSAQFRREYKKVLHVQKQEAHRKQIRMAQKRILKKDKKEENKECIPKKGDNVKKARKTKTIEVSKATKKSKNKDTLEYPCGICNHECITQCVCCDLCDRWYHFECLGKTGEEDDFSDDWFCAECGDWN